MESDDDLQDGEMWSELLTEQNPELNLLADLVKNISMVFEAQHGPIERRLELATTASGRPVANTLEREPHQNPAIAIEGYQPLTLESEHSLPSELVEIIFLYLTINNFVPAMLVCRAWREMISSKKFISCWLSCQPVPEIIWRKYFPLQTLVATSPICSSEKEFEGVPNSDAQSKREVQLAESALLDIVQRIRKTSSKQILTSEGVYNTMKENICTYVNYVLPETKLLNVCLKYDLATENEVLLYIVAYLQMPPLTGEQILEMFTKVHARIFAGYDIHHPTMYTLSLREPSANGFGERASDLLLWFKSILELYLTPEKILASKDCKAIRQCLTAYIWHIAKHLSPVSLREFAKEYVSILDWDQPITPSLPSDFFMENANLVQDIGIARLIPKVRFNDSVLEGWLMSETDPGRKHVLATNIITYQKGLGHEFLKRILALFPDDALLKRNAWRHQGLVPSGPVPGPQIGTRGSGSLLFN